MRKLALAARRNLAADERARASARICDSIIRSAAFLSANRLACYLPMRDEVDPMPLIERAWRAQKRVFVPVIDGRRTMKFCELGPGSVVTRNEFGLWEPVSRDAIDPRRLDVIITPVVVFDDACNRIGMGGGYYDRCFRFLKKRRKWLKPKLIGVAFECQRAARIRPDAWDVSLYRVVTENS